MGFQSFCNHITMKYLTVPKAPIPQAGKKLVACVGDSITYGAGVRENHNTSTWEYHLEKMLQGEWQVLNYGITGRTLQNEGDYPYTAEKFWKLTHVVEADIYLIMLGTNDAKSYNWLEARYAYELRNFVESYVRLPNSPRVILMTPPSCFPQTQTGIVGYDIDPIQIDGPIYRIVRRTAAELGLRCIDLHSFTAGHPEWFDDGIHPNYKGNLAIAKYLYNELQSDISEGGQ